MPEAMPKTIKAADHVRRCGCLPGARYEADDLLQALAVVECDFTVRGAEGVPSALLRDLVLIIARLVGRNWLEANAAEAATLTTWQTARQMPALPDLDRVLAGVLSRRFAQAPATAAVPAGLGMPGTFAPMARLMAG
jgi:hypothetical protein